MNRRPLAVPQSPSTKVNALTVEHIRPGINDVLLISKVHRTAVPSPHTLRISNEASFPQTPGRPGFHCVHHYVRVSVTRDDRVNVIRPHIQCVECPVSMRTDLKNRVSHARPGLRPEDERRVCAKLFMSFAPRVRGDEAGYIPGTASFVRTAGIAVQARAVGGESDEVSSRIRHCGILGDCDEQGGRFADPTCEALLPRLPHGRIYLFVASGASFGPRTSKVGDSRILLARRCFPASLTVGSACSWRAGPSSGRG